MSRTSIKRTAQVILWIAISGVWSRAQDPGWPRQITQQGAKLIYYELHLRFVVNTNWPLFLDTDKSQYYLLVAQQWLSARDLHGPWSPTSTLPKDTNKLPADPHWAQVINAIPPPTQRSAVIPTVFYSVQPAEVILFDGKPVYADVPNTQLLYVTNTDSPVFVYKPTGEYYYLAAGRWFRTRELEGMWSFASLDLRPYFARIPPNSPTGGVLASVPGTEEAKDSVLIAQIPTTELSALLRT